MAGRTGYPRGMKHVPESHQSIAPDRGVVIILAAILVTMVIVYVVVTLAD